MDLKRGDMMASRLRQSHDTDAAGYVREIRDHELFFRHNYLRHLPADKSAPILDIGCGLGHFLEFCRIHGRTDLTGVDLGQANVEFLRARGFNVELGEGGEFLKSTERQFRAIVMNDVITHSQGAHCAADGIGPRPTAAGRRADHEDHQRGQSHLGSAQPLQRFHA